MKKQVTAIITAALILANLTGCSTTSEPINDSLDNSSASLNSGSSGTTSLSAPSSRDSAPSTSLSTDPAPSDTSGMILQVSEWTDYIGPDGQQVTLSDAAVDEQGRVTFDYGFIKYAPPIYDDSLKNPDLINWETFELVSYNDTYTPTVKRLKVGDVLENGLKVAKAYETLEFGTYMDEATLENRSEWGVYGGELSFDGELTLSGALYCVPEDDYQVFDGELYFFPDTTSFSQLPVGCRFISAENKEYTVLESVFPDAKLAVVGGAMYYLGNISETDCGGVIEKGKAAEVTVTIKNIRIVSSNTNFGGRGGGIFADIDSIEKINN